MNKIEKLMQLQPQPPELDRDMMMVEMGRRSARGSSIWKWCASLLAITQIISLSYIIWFLPEASDSPVVVQPKQLIQDAPKEIPKDYDEPDPLSYIRMLREWNSNTIDRIDDEEQDSPMPKGDDVPLRATDYSSFF